MSWGVFELPGEIHVAPCSEDGELIDGHILDDCCLCFPRIDDRVPGTRIIIHEMEV